MTVERAEEFARIALNHVGREYPAKFDHHMVAGPHEVKVPRALHPLFYGSLDWHSSVHTHWLLARLYRRFTGVRAAGDIRAWLDGALTPDKVAGELAYLNRPTSTSGFQRPYGWAWLLMLQAELETHATDEGRRWAKALRPLAETFAARFKRWLPLATYPTRVGANGNTAFALVLARRYALATGDRELAETLAASARRWYGMDAACQAWEPSGTDALSPTLMEAECMRAFLPRDEFESWFGRFLPDLARGEPATLFTPVTVSDRSDGLTAHLDGVNLNRAWAWRHLAAAVPPSLKPRLEEAARRHLDAALPYLASENGDFWLASFAFLALDDCD
ncbi:DUF2891 domain-containing protein [Bradyrhizobium sp. 147]|nr:DUF2891 domain-containing protein [Bradyrhizobium sp. 147]